MRKVISAFVLAGLVAAPAVARAQAHAAMAGGDMPKHEFGVDLGVGFIAPSGGSSGLLAQTPVDVRVGFVSSGSIQFEPRFTLFFTTAGGGTTVKFDPGVNLLFKMGHGTGMHNLMGPYFTVGGDINIQSYPGSVSGQIITVNGGIGTRMPYGGGATRMEGFVSYSLKNTSLGVPNTFGIGVRLGLSLWH